MFATMRWKFEQVPENVARLRRTIKRRDKRWTVRLKYQKVCVMRSPKHKDMKTPAQLKCRERFCVVNAKVAEEFRDIARVKYWEKKARVHGYKTARGCARAFYMEEMRKKELCNEEESVINERKSEDITQAVSIPCYDWIDIQESPNKGDIITDRGFT